MKTINIATLVAIIMVVPNSGSPLFWPNVGVNNDVGQAAAGGALLGIAGFLTLDWLKGNRGRGKREADHDNVSCTCCLFF